MQDLVEQLVSYLRGIWIHRWTALVIVWILCLIGWPFVLHMPNQYVSEAKVYVDTQSLLKPLLRGLTVQTNPEQEVQLMVKTLLTRPNLEKIVRLADLDIQAKNNTELEAIIHQLRANIELERADRGENIYNISYSSRSPKKSKNVVEATLSTLVENTLGNKRLDSSNATDFLDRQIANYESRLNEADNKLKEFKQKNYSLMSSDSGFYSRINDLKTQIKSIELQLKEAETRRDTVKKQLDGEITTDGTMNDGLSMDDGLSTDASQITTRYDERIDNLESQLDQLRLKYTDKYPDIQSTERILEDLKAKRQQEQNKLQAARNAQQRDSNQDPVSQQLKLSLANEEANVQSLKVRLADYQQQLADVQRHANAIPELEKQLQELQRGYSVTLQRYNELLQRRESARMSVQADATADGLQFRVIDPPRLPTAPAGPNRLLFLSGVLAGAGIIGFGIAFLISQLRPVFFESRELYQITGYPVLGVISMTRDAKFVSQKRREALIFLSLAGLLLAVYGVLITLQLSSGINQKLLAYVSDTPNADMHSLKQLADTLLNYFQGLS